MKNKILLSMLIIFFLISCNRGNLRRTVETAVKYDEPSETSQAEVYSNEIPKTLDIVDYYSTLRRGIINADCDYYNGYMSHGGRLAKGENIITFDGYYSGAGYKDENNNGHHDVRVEIRTTEHGISMWVDERYITYSDELYTAWFKNILFTAEHYYTGAVDKIFDKDFGGKAGQDSFERERVIRWWGAVYSKTPLENRLRISENYFIMEIAGGMEAYRLKSITNVGNIYTLYLSEYSGGELEVTLVDDGDGITLTQYAVKRELRKGNYMPDVLNIRYVPHDNEKSKKVRDAFLAWCDEQIEILARSVVPTN